MRVVMTLLTRNEADIVDAQIAFHLNAGVDYVVATDNRSSDGTKKILEKYERAGFLHLLQEDGDDMRQEVWVTRMARLAATQFDADWVINSDADEFWWPRGGSLKDVLATVPDRYGVVRGCWRHFLPRPDDGSFFAERMVVRLATPADPGDKETIFHAHQKVAHRAHPEVEVEPGNHNAAAPGFEPLRTWHPIEVLHFSIRSVAQIMHKADGGWLRRRDLSPTLHQVLLNEAVQQRRTAEFYESFAIDEHGVARALADGTAAVDKRVRDALRALRRGDGSFALPGSARRSHFRAGVSARMPRSPPRSLRSRRSTGWRAFARVDALERRLADLEQGPLRWLRRLAP